MSPKDPQALRVAQGFLRFPKVSHGSILWRIQWRFCGLPMAPKNSLRFPGLVGFPSFSRAPQVLWLTQRPKVPQGSPRIHRYCGSPMGPQGFLAFSKVSVEGPLEVLWVPQDSSKFPKEMKEKASKKKSKL